MVNLLSTQWCQIAQLTLDPTSNSMIKASSGISQILATFQRHALTPDEICPKCATPSSVTYDHRWVTVKGEPLRRSNCLLRIRCSTTYRKLIREHFPKAQIVADKFHVLRLFTKALRTLRHQAAREHKHLPPLRRLLKSRKKLEEELME